MPTNFRIIFFCVILVFIPNLVKPPCANSVETNFKSGFCSFVSFFSAVEIKNNTLDWRSEAMDDFNKRFSKFGNVFFDFFYSVASQDNTVSNCKPYEAGDNAESRMGDDFDKKIVHMFISIVLALIAYLFAYDVVIYILAFTISSIWRYLT